MNSSRACFSHCLCPKCNQLIDECVAINETIFILSLIHIYSIVRELGKFHGECYALKETNRGLFHIITKGFKESRYAREPDIIWSTMMKVSPKRGTQTIREHPELKRVIPEEFLKKIDELSDGGWEYSKRILQPREPLATICHGDFLRNNIAFQYDENVMFNL